MKPLRRQPRLDDTAQAREHLALVCNPRHFASHTFLLILCDVRAEPLLHVEVVDCDPDAGPTDCSTVLGNLLFDSCGATTGVHGVALALTRPGDEGVQAIDRTWFRAFHRTCHARRLRPLGVYVVGVHGARPVQIDDAA
ncbi:MAG: hypothetical protein M3445_06925 [Actinomycetota bacterium]|jgi:hypothetical protein|nr:hypothetical protein [Actinomycetota bacterium]